MNCLLIVMQNCGARGVAQKLHAKSISMITVSVRVFKTLCIRFLIIAEH